MLNKHGFQLKADHGESECVFNYAPVTLTLWPRCCRPWPRCSEDLCTKHEVSRSRVSKFRTPNRTCAHRQMDTIMH